jgi:hypothetical protein
VTPCCLLSEPLPGADFLTFSPSPTRAQRRHTDKLAIPRSRDHATSTDDGTMGMTTGAGMGSDVSLQEGVGDCDHAKRLSIGNLK